MFDFLMQALIVFQRSWDEPVSESVKGASDMAIKIGDIVQLKSGGPKMTVILITGDTVHTSWFAGQKNEKAMFHRDAVIPAEDEKK
ncbi:YodC family protein [Gellertiella hungarica]|uniref:Uncharacterized protein YodC (DUF2158 family) n=1 Tax=Gellertiella hungarica TaxID=1572859 RepID=A0A7W6NJS2_9HYPH|nr:DUF2158 domain-containing protein [Gellertiella hungarica]MBB4063670.1 uncharacterized protein YodC (DUF2158 family) [Gellertiella hungarica]